MPRDATPAGRCEVVLVVAGDPAEALILRVVREHGGAARAVARLDAVTAGGRVVVVVADRAGPAGVAAAVAAGASAVVAVVGPGADVAGLLGAGALAVVPAADVERELPAGLEAVSAGALYVAPDCTGTLRSALNLEAAETLTPRELETLRWVATGCTHREVAERMRVAEATVNTYLKRLRSKLNVTNKAELTRVALRLGLV
ncbi:LuxR C-terminal-related transcriptional regulator [Dactylosporangium sp. NBC_01737]|uniref:helix-turn-helix transcriptional regulator n=1 Tax=Dactylosporangium sp. NBC_01737 TaxID=2975959 RepID=UPI002E0D436A|nr:LuxR C-terminal-related transcriptional regulator [Dactylosporangium sp. NBC_01737]